VTSAGRAAAVLAALMGLAILHPGSASAARSGLDKSFGGHGTGIVELDPGAGRYFAATVTDLAAVRGGASYVVSRGGTCQAGPCESIRFLERFRFDGSPSPGFNGPEGSVPVVTGGVNVSNPIVGGDGGLTIAFFREGSAPFGKGSGFVVRRYGLNGQPDPGFGDGGEAFVECPVCGAMAIRLAWAGGGRILVAGSQGSGGTAEPPPPGSGSRLEFARLSPDGSVDTSFGSGGRASIGLASREQPWGVAVRNNGPVYVYGGNRECACRNNGYVARVSQSGRLDTRFGARVEQSLSSVSKRFGTPVTATATVLVRPGGRIDMLGFRPRGRGYAIRLLPSGELAPRFGDGGVRRLSLGVSTAALDEAGGTFGISQTWRGVLAFRLTSSDRMDPSFGSGNGIPVPGAERGTGYSVATQAHRRALVLDAGLKFCRQECPATPRLLRFLEGPGA
jgi:uncharacterized delta-60 repeat protein